MSGLASKQLKASNCNELLPNEDGSINTVAAGGSLKEKICSAADIHRDYTWTTVAGVRKVSQIVFTSASVDAETGDTNVLTRTFAYNVVAPYDLLQENDALTVT